MIEDDIFASPKSRLTTTVLAAILGPFGAHRFFVGRIKSAILMACTLGGLGLWYVYDLIIIASGSFRDAEGRLVTEWEPDTLQVAGGMTASAMLDEIDALRAEMTELHQRVEFTERLLSDPDREPRRRP